LLKTARETREWLTQGKNETQTINKDLIVENQPSITQTYVNSPISMLPTSLD